MRIRKLFRLTKGYRFAFCLLVLLVVFLRWSYSYVPLFTQYLIRVLDHQGTLDTTGINLPQFLFDLVPTEPVIEAALYIAGALIAWQLFRFVIMFFENFYKGYVQERITEKLRINIYEHVQNLPYKFHNNADTGDLIQRATSDVETTTRFVIVRVLDAVSLIASIITGAIQMYFLNPVLMWISLAAIPITAVSSIIYFLKIDKLFQDVEEKESSMMTVIQENISASKVVKSFANEQFEIEKMDVKNRAYSDSNIKANRIVAYYWGGMDFLMMLQFFAVVLIGVLSARNGQMDAASVAASLMLVGMLIWPVRGLGRLINDFGKALVASDRIYHILEQSTEYIDDGTLMPEITGNIKFKDVTFKFDDAKEALLKSVTFSIKEGETVAFVGKTGSGKTTIINLLLKHHQYEGSILIDGVELRDIKKNCMRKNIGVVLQDPFLYSKTVYENIAIANRKASQNKVHYAAQIASIEKDIKTFKNGYETVVGEKGATLSGGQKQRVAIARVLVEERPILIFDDALSALDNKTDLSIRQALKEKQGKQTTLIITHRITTAKEADKIIVLNRGCIEAIGKHEDLSNQPGLYQNLWQIQGKLEDEFLAMIKAGETHA